MYRCLLNVKRDLWKQCVRFYSKGATGAASGSGSRHLEVEEDPEKLYKYVCGANIYIEGSDPEIKPDSEYPDWLWTLRTERGAPKLEDLNPNTYKYWRHVRRKELNRKSKLRKVMFRFKEFG